MTRSGQARKFARKTLRKTGGATRRVMCVQMVLYTLIIAATAALAELNTRKILPLDPYMPYLLPAAMFLLALTNLLINAPLTAIARKSGDGAFSRMNFGRVLIAILLAVLPAAALFGLIELFNLVNNQWKPIMEWALTDNTHIALSCAAAAAGMLLIVYFCGVIGVFSRQLMLYMADNPDRMKGASVGQIIRNGFAHAFAPVLLVLRSLFWFLLLLIIVAALTVAACFITSTITLDVPFDMVVMQITAAITAPLPAWAIGSILILGVVWVLGIGQCRRTGASLLKTECC